MNQRTPGGTSDPPGAPAAPTTAEVAAIHDLTPGPLAPPRMIRQDRADLETLGMSVESG